MTTKHYTAHSDAEATSLHAGTQSMIVEPMEPQPKCGPLHMSRGVWRDTQGMPGYRWIPHYAPGDIIGVKEAWSSVPVDDGDTMGYIYRADGESAFDSIAEGWEFMGKWESAESMPDEAVRTRLLVLSVEARQVQTITPSETLAFGIDLPVPAGCNPSPPPDGFDKWPKERRDDWCKGMARAVYFARERDVRMHLEAFATEWDRRHPATPWDGNPFAWFTKTERINE